MLNCIIVDDEVNCAETLQLALGRYCKSVHVISVINNSLKAEEEIRKHKPDIVFMDIEMPHLTGFDVLAKTTDVPFSVIFTTAYDHYALKAIKHNALDYLLKPIDMDELITAVKRVEEKAKPAVPEMSKIETFLSQLVRENNLQKLAVPSMEGIIYLEIDSIIRISADRNYSDIHLVNAKKITSSKTLKEYEQALAGHHFFRVHNTHLVNLKFITKYIKGVGGTLVMSDGANIEVSRDKKKELLELLG
jgi:two-component system LytT family response regulator